MAAKKGVKKGQPKPEYTLEEKKKLVERICELYESQNATLESCCDAVGITARAFLLWRQNYSDFSERFKKAKEIQDENYWQDVIRPLGKRAIQKHLEVEFAEEEKDVVYEGLKTGDIQKTKKWILPNPTVTIFAMKGIYPEIFTERQDVRHSGSVKVVWKEERTQADEINEEADNSD